MDKQQECPRPGHLKDAAFERLKQLYRETISEPAEHQLPCRPCLDTEEIAQLVVFGANKAMARQKLPLLCYDARFEQTGKVSKKVRGRWCLSFKNAFPERGDLVAPTGCNFNNRLKNYMDGCLSGGVLTDVWVCPDPSPGYKVLKKFPARFDELRHKKVGDLNGWVALELDCVSSSYDIRAYFNRSHCGVCQKGF